MRTLEESTEREQQAMATLRQKHAEEVSQMEKEMREELNLERERLLNQIRELTIMKQHASAEVLFRVKHLEDLACTVFYHLRLMY